MLTIIIQPIGLFVEITIAYRDNKVTYEVESMCTSGEAMTTYVNYHLQILNSIIMAKKFIITKDKFIMGNVGYHADLASRLNKETLPVLGGGRWDVDKDEKILYLWGASVDYGFAEPGQIRKALESEETFISPSLDEFKVLHSSIISDYIPDKETFTELLILKQ